MTAAGMRRVSALQGWRWLTAGLSLFLKAPLIWVTLFVISILAALGLSLLPYIGPLLVQLLSPVLVGGFMLGCKSLEEGEDLEIGHLLQGFRTGGAQLITVGGIYLVASILINKIMFVVGGPEMAKLITAPNPQAIGPDALAAAWEHIALATAVGMLLFTPLAMATWFAPALVVFQGLGPLESLKRSFLACLLNMTAFLVYGLASLALTMLALIPLSLGLLVLGPVLIGSFYAGYKDIFGDPAQAD